tara:strand:- start:206 stop:436 length:231 start_codon:yes stop_codon:yes gene_type:complete
MELIRFNLIGLIILVVAILANFFASQLGLKTWYDFLNNWGNGEALRVKDGLWLFIFYPLILGGSAQLGNMIWKHLF